MDPFNMNAPNASQLEIPGADADSGLKRDQSGYSLELLPNRVRRLKPILPPPGVQLADLRLSELAYSM
jgi:hypothetical protein